MNQYIHTPEGVRDIYGKEYAARLEIRGKIRAMFHRFGYQDIQTPSFEFYDIFSKEKGSVGSKQMFKFFDRDGETMVLRPDMTPAIARCAAKYFSDEQLPLRLSYIENTFINRTSLQGRLKEFTQAGVELLGDGSPEADGEVLALTIQCLLAAGLTDFQLEVGHVGFLQGLLEEADLSDEAEETICQLLANKNFFGVEEQISHCGVDPDIETLFARLPELFGSVDQIAEAAKLIHNDKALQAIERLQQVYQVLCCYGLEQYVTFDLGMSGRYRYYNGMIFKGYTYGSGRPIVTGGRYDNLMEQFGRKAQAVGFAIVLDSVMAALSRQKIAVEFDCPEVIFVYTQEQREAAIARVCSMRDNGIMVCLQKMPPEDNDKQKDGFQVEMTCMERSTWLESCLSYAASHGFTKLCYLDEDGFVREVRV